MKFFNTLTALVVCLVCFSCSASNSWYVVNNYEGIIGKYPVHLSIQSYDFGEGIKTEGSYYYDKYNAPIALYGIETSATMSLCEVANGKEFDKYIVNGAKYVSENCSFKLSKSNSNLQGIWNKNGAELNVSLKLVSSMDNTSISGSDDGTIDIPFWGQTGTHSFIGVYGSGENGLFINKIKVINKKNGALVQIIAPQKHGCEFGFYMTSIFQNIDSGSDKSQITLNCYSTGSDFSVMYEFDKKQQQYLLR
jgi:hypothetical protein